MTPSARSFEPTTRRKPAAQDSTEPSAGLGQNIGGAQYWFIYLRHSSEGQIDPEIVRRAGARAIHAGLGALKRTKNGQCARAGAVSMGPSALDQESGAFQTCVRSGQISRGRPSVPRQRQCRQNTGSTARRTRLRGGWDCPRSLAAAAGRDLLG